MPAELNNLEFIRAFVRNINNIQGTSRQSAKRMADELESIVLSRVGSSHFIGGDWANKPYSINPIKAFKLGNAIVSGQGMGKQLTINGILIDRDDWYWGNWDQEKHGVTLSGGRPAENFGDSYSGKPAPVFIPGYRGWRVKYNGLQNEVNLDFSGNMLNSFYVDIHKGRGANQYGGDWRMSFEVEEPFHNIGQMTDYYRNWLSVTEDELREAIRESGADLASLFAI